MLAWAMPVAFGGCTLVGIQAPPLDDLRIEWASIEPDRLVQRPAHDEANVPVLQLVVSTKAELSDYRRRFDNSLEMLGASCWGADRRRPQTDAIRNPDGSIVDNTAFHGILASARMPDDDGRRRYLFAFRIAGPERQATAFDDEAGTLHAHDLRTQPLDVCFRVQGGNMIFAHRSRTYRIPYAMIAEALARAGLPHAPVP